MATGLRRGAGKKGAAGPGPSRRYDAASLARDLLLRQGSVGTLVALAAICTMYLAKALVLPLVLAVLLSVLLGPCVRALDRMRIPRPLGAALAVLSTLGLGGVTVVQVWAPAGDWIERAPALEAEIWSKLRARQIAVVSAQEAIRNIEDMASGGEHPSPAIVVKDAALLPPVFAETWAVTVTVVVVYLFLARGEATCKRALSAVQDPERRRIWKGVLDEIDGDLAQYLLTVAIINIAIGVLTAMAMALLDVPTPVLWGVLAGVMGFIPYAGTLVTLAVIGMVSLLTFDDWVAIALPPAVVLLLTVLKSQVVGPLAIGRLGLAPVAMFLSILFWGWLWGLAGMLLAVPILAAIKITLNAVQPLHLFGALTSDDPSQQQGPHNATYTV